MDLSAKIKNLETYLLDKFSERDWHGVADAACDLRVLEAVQKERVKAPALEIEKEQLAVIEDY